MSKSEEKHRDWGLLKNPISCAKSANAVKNRDWERGVFPRACTCFLRPPGFSTHPLGAFCDSKTLPVLSVFSPRADSQLDTPAWRQAGIFEFPNASILLRDTMLTKRI